MTSPWSYLLRVCLAAAALLPLGLCRADNANTNIATVRPEMTIPFMATPPKIDGVIAPGEWNTLHEARFVSQNGDQLERRAGEFWVGADHNNLYIAVRSAVHPTRGVIAAYKPPHRTSEVTMDDSVEIWLNNSPETDTGRYFQILANPNGAMFNARFNFKDKIAETYWNADLQQAHTVKDGVWTAEFAIPFINLGVTDPTQPLAMRVCRNYKLPWDQARWEPLVLAFDSPETMTRVRFADAAPIVTELPVQDEQGITVGLSLSNPTAQTLTQHVRLGYNPQDQPRYYQDKDVTLAPGETAQVVYRHPFFATGNYPAIGEALVTGSGGQTLYHRDFKWQTQPKDPFWDAMAVADVTQATQFVLGWYPSYHLMRWRADFSQFADKAKVKTLRVVVHAKDSPTIVQTQQIPVPKDFAAVEPLPLPGLPSGQYVAELYLDEDKASNKPVQIAEFTQETNFPWKDNHLGMEDIVIPPFTPLTVKGRVVSAVLRQHTMADNGLWSQVSSEGQDILTGPMRLEVRQGNKAVPVTAKLAFQSANPTRVVATSDWSAGSLHGRTTSDFDYDGCMKVTVDLAPSKTPVGTLDIVIPLKASIATLMHACGDGARFNYGGFIPPGQDTVWSSVNASRDLLLGTFLPYLWVGGPERGLVWFASNDRDWVLDPSDKTPALSLERQGQTLSLRVHLIQTPGTLDRPRHIVFGLQATPTKPMPENPDWRLRGVGANSPDSLQALGMSMYWGADLYSVFPRDKNYALIEKIAAAEKQGKRDDAFFQAYLTKNPDFRAEVIWASNQPHANGIIPYTNLRGEITSTPEWVVYQDEWRLQDLAGHAASPAPGSVDGICTPVPSRQDYALYYYRELLRHGFDGIYWDNSFLLGNANPVTGAGYVRPDGQYQPDTDLWLLRQLLKRVAVMAYVMGKPNLGMPHMTNANLIPLFSWTTSALDWEQHYGGTDFQDRFPRDYIRAVSLGRQSGNTPIVLPGIRDVQDPKQQAWVERTRLGVCMTHELTIWEGDAYWQKVRNYLYTLGYGTPACKTFHYWDDAPALSVSGVDASWIAFENKDTVAVMVTDYGGGGDARLTLDTKRLGLPADFTAVNWEDPAQTWAAKGGVLMIPGLPKHDFRLLVIRKGGLPQ